MEVYEESSQDTLDGQRRLEIPADLAGTRVDKALSELLREFSRSRIQQLIKAGLVLIDDEVPRQKDRVAGGERVELAIPDSNAIDWAPEEIPLEIIHQDETLIVLNKPAGLVVHPGAGNRDGTLLNGLLCHDSNLVSLPRAGIVHRLDKETTGLMVVARSEAARLDLVGQLSARAVKREYLALVAGRVIAGGTIEEPIGRDRHDRRRMTVTAGGKDAVTHYRVEERFRDHTLLRVSLGSGRTHQIRVHMRHVGFPVVGDPVYGGRLKIPAGCAADLAQALRSVGRQMLHAGKLGFRHPLTAEYCYWEAGVPGDMSALLDQLRDGIRVDTIDVGA